MNKTFKKYWHKTHIEIKYKFSDPGLNNLESNFQQKWNNMLRCICAPLCDDK